MSNYAIITDTTCDLPESIINDNQIDVIPLSYTIDNVTYGTDINIPLKDFYGMMRNGLMPTTSACNPEAVENSLRKHLNSGEDILYIAFSSALSSSYNTAAVVGQELAQEYPNRKIIVIDSKSASLGEGLFVYKAICNKDSGMTIDENAAWLEENKLHVCHQFTVDDLHHLHRGGRVSKTTAIIGTMINVKPVLHVNNEGQLISLNNVRGRKKALNSLVDNMEKSSKDYNNDIVFISHGDCIEDAEYVANLVKTRLGINNVVINYISPTIGAHAGPGTVALFFLGEIR